MTRRRFPIAPEVWLDVMPRGTAGSFGLACALGLNVLPASMDAALDRAEWVDIVAKARGMYHAAPELLWRFPVARQFCGCRCCFDPTPDRGLILARFVVRLCTAHPWASIPGDAADPTVPEDGVIVLGSLVASTR